MLVTSSGICKISGFVLSKKNTSPAKTAITGILFCMAPETIDIPPEGYDCPVDIWAFGCIFHEMLTGRRPWVGQSMFAVIEKVRVA